MCFGSTWGGWMLENASEFCTNAGRTALSLPEICKQHGFAPVCSGEGILNG
jgi:hypothetical protein